MRKFSIDWNPHPVSGAVFQVILGLSEVAGGLLRILSFGHITCSWDFELICWQTIREYEKSIAKGG